MVDAELSNLTIRSRINMVDVVCRASGVTDPRDLTRLHIRGFITDRQLKPASTLKYLEHLRLWARFEGVPDPTEGIKRPRRPRYRPRPLLPDVYQRVMAHYAEREPTVHLWARLGGELGLRSFEVAKMCGNDLDEASRTLHVVGKARLDTTIDVPDDLFNVLWELARDCPGRLWPKAHNKKVSQDAAIYAAQIGIRLGFHQFRHTAITAYYQKTRDLVATQHFARHESPETTAIYALADRRNHRNILNNLHSDTDDKPPENASSRDVYILDLIRELGMDVGEVLRMLLERRQNEIQGDSAD